MPVARNCQKTFPCQNVNKSEQNISQSQYIHLFILVITYKDWNCLINYVNLNPYREFMLKIFK